MAQVINGSDLMLFIDGKSIAFATSHKLSINVETVETTSKDSGGKWVSKAARKISWNCSTENLYSNDGEGMTFSQLFDLMVAREPIEAVFTLEKDYATKADEVPTGGWIPSTTGTYVGNVIITALEANAPNGDNATFTASFEGVGALTKDSAESGDN